jgi:hypothetical protein
LWALCTSLAPGPPIEELVVKLENSTSFSTSAQGIQEKDNIEIQIQISKSLFQFLSSSKSLDNM